MTRPTPKKTSLNTQHPGEPPQEHQAAEQAKPAAPAAQQAAEQPAQNAGETAGQPAKKWRHKMSIYQDPSDTARIRGAIIHTIAHEGNRTLSQFVNEAVMKEVRRLEEKYNGGEPFPEVSPKGIPQGRPMGE